MQCTLTLFKGILAFAAGLWFSGSALAQSYPSSVN